MTNKKIHLNAQKCTSCIKRYALSTKDTLVLKKINFLDKKVQKNTLEENEDTEKMHFSALTNEKGAELIHF